MRRRERKRPTTGNERGVSEMPSRERGREMGRKRKRGQREKETETKRERVG